MNVTANSRTIKQKKKVSNMHSGYEQSMNTLTVNYSMTIQWITPAAGGDICQKLWLAQIITRCCDDAHTSCGCTLCSVWANVSMLTGYIQEVTIINIWLAVRQHAAGCTKTFYTLSFNYKITLYFKMPNNKSPSKTHKTPVVCLINVLNRICLYYFY